MKEIDVLVDFRGSGYIRIWTEENETVEDIAKLSNEKIVDRIMEFSDLVDLIDDHYIEIEDIIERKE